MSQIYDQKIEDSLKKELEGKLFVDINVSTFQGNTYFVSKDWYTVLNGKVVLLSNGVDGSAPAETGDTLLSLITDCKRIGVYNKDKKYKRILKKYTYSEIKKLLKV
jgi:hypothetical protein